MPAKLPGSVIAASVIIGALILLLWVLQLATITDLNGSDAAGNGLARAFAAIETITLWVLLAILMIVLAISGVLEMPAMIAAGILIPLSGVAAMAALELLVNPYVAPFRWPVIVSAIVPPLITAFALSRLVPSLRVPIFQHVSAGVVWGVTLLACISILPMQHLRQSVNEQEKATRDNAAADFASVPENAALWDLTPFLAARDQTLVTAAVDRIRSLARRQGDAEIMLDRGDFPIGRLGAFDLTPSPAICDKARALLRKRVEPLVLKSADTKPYSEIALQVSDAADAMTWLVNYGCNCDAESSAWESMAKAYRDYNYDVYRLRDLRDPPRLGRTLREDPENFSMLTPQAHLKAWLKFAGNKEYRDQALAGARNLDHRTADAVELLGKDDVATRYLLENLKALDLEATPALCSVANNYLHQQFTPIFRPRADDPRSYQELLGRLGRGDHFDALVWFAGHGCDADAEINEAESLIRAYQTSRESTAMLAALAQVRKK